MGLTNAPLVVLWCVPEAAPRGGIADVTSGQESAAAPPRDRAVGGLIIGAVLGLGIGYVVLIALQAAIAWIWDTVPSTWDSAPAWYVVSVPLAAALLVFLIRRFLGDHGHSPLGGIAVASLSPRAYLDAILAIAATLLGGLVLGPEVALVATGSVVGGLVARATHAADPKRIVMASAGGAILALFVGPLLSGSLALDNQPTSLAIPDLAWAIPVALATAVIVAIVRWGGGLLDHVVRGAPRLWALVGAALVVSASALLLQGTTGAPITFVVTSGEGYISDLAAETATSTVLAVVLFKALAYGASLGSGFRGGPFFPVMFVGAAVGLLCALLLPSGPSTQAAIVVGVTASVIATAPMKWVVAVVLGGAIGFAFGGWALVPAAVVGALAARAVPRFGDRVMKPVAAAPH